jgi:hypothetical protein
VAVSSFFSLRWICSSSSLIRASVSAAAGGAVNLEEFDRFTGDTIAYVGGERAIFVDGASAINPNDSFFSLRWICSSSSLIRASVSAAAGGAVSVATGEVDANGE